LIEIFTTSTFYSKFKENNKNDMTFCYVSFLAWYCFRPTSMAALQLLTLSLADKTYVAGLFLLEQYV
jgi:hypothetical protein